MTNPRVPQYDTSTLLSEILSLGSSRLNDLEHGGILMASFGDWAWATGQTRALEVFDLWLATVYNDPNPPPDHVSRAVAYLNHMATEVTP